MANSPTSNSYCKSKKAPQERAGCMAGSQWIFGMRDGWHTIPVKLLSQLRLSFGPPCSSNSSMGLSRYKRNRFRLHVLDSVYCSYWANQSCRPTIWTNNRGTQARFCQSFGTTGENDVRSAVATQWPTSMRYEDALDLDWRCMLRRPVPDIFYIDLMVLRETTED